MKTINKNLQQSIINLLISGLGDKQVARQLGISPSTVNKYKKFYNIIKKEKKGGRPKVLTETKKRLIKRKILDGTYKTAADVRISLEQEGYNISLSSIKRHLNAMGFESRIKKKKPLITKKNKAIRLKWAKEHKSWTVNDWKKVIFSDETKINIFGSDGVKYCWVKPGDPLLPHHLNLTVKHGGGSLLMWACISYKGVGCAYHIKETMNAQLYCNIIKNELKTSLKNLKFKKKDIIF
jgi:transposase